jgi:hypothetical protein
MALSAFSHATLLGYQSSITEGKTMAAYIWNANPGKWDLVPPSTDSWESLREYVSHESGYVYWSTPVLHRDIRKGDDAFLWRTNYKERQTGIIAVGSVEEAPRQLSFSSEKLFGVPDRIYAPGWKESSAPSQWKTGIRITSLFWNKPVQVGLRISQGTVRRLKPSEITEVSNAMACG